MELRLYDISMPSINPTSILGTSTTQLSGGPITIGSATTPGLPYPTVEGIYRVVLDGSPTTPVVKGNWVQCNYVANNLGAAYWLQTTVAQAAYGRFKVGVVVSPPVPYGGPNGTFLQNVPGGQSLICVEGPALVNVTAAGGGGIGALLTTSATAGTLSQTAPTSYNQIVATALQTISGAGSFTIVANIGY
jgi:hypothetical protein